MRIGVPRELANGEGRVAMTSMGVKEIVGLGHEVFVCSNAGKASGISDDMYEQAGGKILDNIGVYAHADLIVKVKPPTTSELEWIREGQAIFSYILPERNEALLYSFIEKKVMAIGYEGIVDQQGRKPLLMPMSELAGKMAVLTGSKYLQYINGGMGILLGSVAGVASAEVVVLGAGSAARGALEMTVGLGCNVTVINRSRSRLIELKDRFHGVGNYLSLSHENICDAIQKSDLLINTIDQMGDKKNHLITTQMVKNMKKGSVIMDVACDNNGTIETSIQTNFDSPTYTIDGVIHCAIPNLPGTIPKTATLALTYATLPFIKKIGIQGLQKSLLNELSLRKGLCVYGGHLLHKKASENFSIPYKSFESVFEG